MLILGRILERGIKNLTISITGYQFYGKFFLERGANLESRAAHPHPKNTQVPPPPAPTPRVWFLPPFGLKMGMVYGGTTGV